MRAALTVASISLQHSPDTYTRVSSQPVLHSRASLYKLRNSPYIKLTYWKYKVPTAEQLVLLIRRPTRLKLASWARHASNRFGHTLGNEASHPMLWPTGAFTSQMFSSTGSSTYVLDGSPK